MLKNLADNDNTGNNIDLDAYSPYTNTQNQRKINKLVELVETGALS